MTACTTPHEAPHQTDEPWPFLVTYRDTPVTTGVEACILPDGQDLTDDDWLPAIVIAETDGSTSTNVLVSGLAAGWHRVWARVLRGGRHVVHDLGTIHLT